MSTKTNDLNPDRTNLIETAELTRSNLIAQLNHIDTITGGDVAKRASDALAQAGKEIAAMQSELSLVRSVSAEYDERSTAWIEEVERLEHKLSEQSATIEAVTKWRHDWFNEPVDGVPRKRHVQRLDEILDRNPAETTGDNR
jgi:chemotaxis regulatin CheY-phosphate phosphatase CheZ